MFWCNNMFADKKQMNRSRFLLLIFLISICFSRQNEGGCGICPRFVVFVKAERQMVLKCFMHRTLVHSVRAKMK